MSDMQDVKTKKLDMVQVNIRKDGRLIEGLKSTNMLSSKSAKRLRQLLLTAVVSGALIAVPRVANAAPHTLSGSQTITQSITDDDATVTTTSDFSVSNTTSGDAVSITGNGSLSYNDGGNNNDLSATGSLGDGLYINSAGDSGNAGSITIVSGGTISGFERGIAAENSGSGSISITASGDVSATGTNAHSNGIHATNTADGENVEIYANNENTISGTKHGIYVFNNGTGKTVVETDGNVAGNEEDAISVENTSISTGNLEVKANNVTGNDAGIDVINRGTGDVNITTTGTVIGIEDSGIKVSNQTTTTGDVTVIANVVNGGGHGIIVSNQNTTGSTSITANGDVMGNTGATNVPGNTHSGIVSRNGGINLTIKTYGNVTGEIGIKADNEGTGETIITNTQTVTGTDEDGILAENDGTATDLTIEVNNVTGDDNGISATNNGSGFTDITVSGNVTGANDDGIYAINSGTDLTIESTGIGTTIQGGDNGIYAQNNGTGITSVKVASGIVKGDTEDGIFVENTNINNANTLSVNAGGSGETVDVTGEIHGINVNNAGTGLVQIYNYGKVEGITGDGIHAIANAGINQTLSITGSAIAGSNNGVFAQNNGVGSTKITTLGSVESTTSHGIYAVNTASNSTGDVTVTTQAVTGGELGIGAINNGTGDISIDVAGNITGNSANGIYALQGNSGAGDISITAINNNSISGATHGIYAQNDGAGSITVRSNGSISGQGATYDGVRALGNSADAENITVEVNDAEGGQYGVFVTNLGTGSSASTNVTTSGSVKGGTAGINIVTSSTANPTTLTINDESVVQNSSGDTGDLAIRIRGNSGSSALATNDGIILGSVSGGNENLTLINNFVWNSSDGTNELGSGDDTIINNNVWETTGGVTDFGDGDDVFHNTGTLWAANPNAVSNTRFLNVEAINNSGVLAMQNGEVGDQLTFTSGDGGFNPQGGIFTANGGTLTVDTDLALQQSDRLIVDNVETGINGSTRVDISIIDGLGQATSGDGILIVDVVGDGYGIGTSTPDAFDLASPVSGGLFSYRLHQGASSPSWFLQSAIRPETAAVGVLPVLGSRTALSTLSNLHDRQRDVKVLLDNSNSKKGVWARAFGQNNDFRSNDSNDFGFNTNLWGVQAGLDLMARGDEEGNRKYAGLYIAYATSSGDARQFGAKVADIDLNATTLGAYYTHYSASNWYLDLVAQYSRLGGVKAKTATDEIKPSGNSYALSLEAGKQFGVNSSVIREVQAQLIDQYTDVKDVTLSDDTAMNLSSVNAVTGRFGVRLYGNPEHGKSFLPWLRANIWHTFSGDSSISSLGSSISTPIGGTSGELELGFSKGNAQSGGWGFYGSAGYLFDISGAEYSGWKGTLGLRKGW